MMGFADSSEGQLFIQLAGLSSVLEKTSVAFLPMIFSLLSSKMSSKALLTSINM